MWTLPFWTVAALAQDPADGAPVEAVSEPAPVAAPFDVASLPLADPTSLVLQVDDEAYWRQVDLRASRTARVGGWLAVGGAAVVLGGVGMIAVAQESTDGTALATAGVTAAVLGGAAMVVGPPMSLAGAMRSNRALREQGVYVSNAAGVTGWTTLGLTSLFYPFFSPLLGGAGWAQIEANRVGRERAGLPPVRTRTVEVSVVPTANGGALVGSF